MGILWSAPRKLPGSSLFRVTRILQLRRHRRPTSSDKSLPPAVTTTNPTNIIPDIIIPPEAAPDTAVVADNTAASSADMSERELQSLVSQMQQCLKSRDYRTAIEHINRAKIVLLSLNALVPSSSVPQSVLVLAREMVELAALISIRRKDHDSFTRYYSQLQPFYDLTPAQLSPERSSRSKITGLYLLLLLSQGDYAGFHTVLESLELAVQSSKDAQQMTNGSHGIEDDAFIQYPIKLEQWLMEGSYDRVWSATESEKVPSEEYGIFSDVLIGTIRSEIASCSEKAYLSLPITNAKNLLFLDSEGAVVEFAQSRGWTIRDGRIHFPQQQNRGVGTEKEILLASGQVIENTIGYARELETIV